MPKYARPTLTPEAALPKEFVELCKSVSAKRARTVIDHILEHGIITNEDLSERYGYDHPPRAIRDVREHGIPLITHRITSPKTGRQIGAYTFDNLIRSPRKIPLPRGLQIRFKESL
ncbi:MAG: helix-turn-helix domain-containing protein [Pseudomonadota bacterium]|nr:helix-turn-helix domain-containing protein [Pseudomonadota bacterium]